MKRTLLLLVCVLGTTAFAGSAYGYGDDPAATEGVVATVDAAAEHGATVTEDAIQTSDHVPPAVDETAESAIAPAHQAPAADEPAPVHEAATETSASPAAHAPEPAAPARHTDDGPAGGGCVNPAAPPRDPTVPMRDPGHFMPCPHPAAPPAHEAGPGIEGCPNPAAPPKDPTVPMRDPGHFMPCPHQQGPAVGDHPSGNTISPADGSTSTPTATGGVGGVTTTPTGTTPTGTTPTGTTPTTTETPTTGVAGEEATVGSEDVLGTAGVAATLPFTGLGLPWLVLGALALLVLGSGLWITGRPVEQS